VFGLPVVVPNAEEGPAYGAALLAGVGVGVWNDVAEACGQAIGVVETREPGAATAARYEPGRAVYDGLYDNLKDQFAALADLDD
jgi:xylulokinase